MKEIIRVENLSKAYRVGQREQSHDTLFGQLADILSAPVRNLKNLRSLTKFNDQDDPTVHWALRDINFTVNEGEVLGIIGHNGAGKSTLLKILSRVTEPTSGHIRIRGRIGALLEVGTGFHPELTGRENIYMNGTILGMTRKEIDRKLDEIIDFAGIEKFIDTPVKFYSSGMKVRLGFAVAAHLEPEILVIDEVLAVGDAEFQKKCLGKMEDVATQGRTVLFVSHNMMAVRNLCQSGLVLKHGILSFYGSVDEAIDFYLKEYSDVQKCLRYDIQEAPGNNEARFLRAEVMPLPGNKWPLEEGHGLRLEFEFLYTGDDDSNLDITFHLMDEYGNLVFVGSTGREIEPQYFNAGIIKAVCDIPPFLMHHGTFTISKLLLVRNRGTIVFGVNNPISFELVPSNQEAWGWMGKKEGIVKPKLNWKLHYDPSN
ncbi:ABC transporter ATP-binding protein [Thermaurantimonas aggregans]|uniref:ABC transporter ATP-binding protein n=1 Tax=Thermaurantimonas aggregans TaxID=2173829 RepID=A0A401XJZ5_9FLAO|nr:polysaccharide ABC transporter ATP-binding protein [Thermaurantimonas aggregans]GCD77355.1 ABC transporter ATP-binding protein [Thermaurantimonas aggregans]